MAKLEETRAAQGDASNDDTSSLPGIPAVTETTSQQEKVFDCIGRALAERGIGGLAESLTFLGYQVLIEKEGRCGFYANQTKLAGIISWDDPQSIRFLALTYLRGRLSSASDEDKIAGRESYKKLVGCVVESHISRAHEFAQKVEARFQDDFFSICLEKLMLLVQTFDCFRGLSFDRYVTIALHRAVKNFNLKRGPKRELINPDLSLVPSPRVVSAEAKEALLSELRSAIEELPGLYKEVLNRSLKTRDNGRPTTTAEIAEELGLTRTLPYFFLRIAKKELGNNSRLRELYREVYKD